MLKAKETDPLLPPKQLTGIAVADAESTSAVIEKGLKEYAWNPANDQVWLNQSYEKDPMGIEVDQTGPILKVYPDHPMAGIVNAGVHTCVEHQLIPNQ